jgi:hypothetical protein
MKLRLFLTLLLITLLVGCATQPNAPSTNPLVYLYPTNEKSVCVSPDYTGSVICKVMTYLKETPEQFNDQLLDASIIGLMTKLFSKQDLTNAISVTRQFVAATEGLTLTKLLGFLETKSEKDEYLKMLLSRKLGRLKIPQFMDLVFTPQDKAMIIYALDSQEAQL